MNPSQSPAAGHVERIVQRPSFGERHGGLGTAVSAPGGASGLAERLPTAAQRLRYEAVLDAIGHMGDDIALVEYRDYAIAKRALQFAAIRPDVDGGRITVGLAMGVDKDERLGAVSDESWAGERIASQFALESHQPIQGWQLKLLRLSYLAAGEVDETWLARR